MTTYNTSADSANTNVRAFLTKVGEFYLRRNFNTSSGWGRGQWERIKTETFDSRCAYCHNKGKLHIEHLIMFNSEQCGLHHPGNIVPCCPAHTRSGPEQPPIYSGDLDVFVRQ